MSKEERDEQRRKDNEFYISIWSERKHICENCGTKLMEEPLTIYFDHILEKSRYPEFRYEPVNIMLLCFECHAKKTDGYLSEAMGSRMFVALTRYHNRNKERETE